MKFYVYELLNSDGSVAYVGKGSGRRLSVQKKAFRLEGREVKRFKSEREAYAFEIKHISACAPSLNKCAGGNGSRTKQAVKYQWQREMDRIGTRAYAANLLSKVGAIRNV